MATELQGRSPLTTALLVAVQIAVAPPPYFIYRCLNYILVFCLNYAIICQIDTYYLADENLTTYKAEGLIHKQGHTFKM